MESKTVILVGINIKGYCRCGKTNIPVCGKKYLSGPATSWCTVLQLRAENNSLKYINANVKYR